MSVYRFDSIVLDTAVLRLTVRGEARALEPKSFRLLQFLVENRDRVVSKEEIFRVVWEDTTVTDNALTRAIAQIRKTLEDDPKQPRFIETAPTVGYRFIGVLLPDEPPVQVRPARPVFAIWTGVAFVLLAVAAFTAWSRLRPETPAPPVPESVPFTSYRGSETEPAFSPDGNQVAFQWDGENEDNADIYVKVLGSETPLRLTTDPAEDGLPTWSPDGRTIAFVRRKSAQRFDLMLLPALGGAERKLAELTPPDKTQISAPEWSPDGKWVLVPAVLAGPERSGLLRISVETGEASQLTDPGVLKQDRYPTVSPDGSMLLFVRANPFNPGDLYAARIDRSANLRESPHRIPSGRIRVGFARWTADGKDILAAAPSAVYRLPVAGTEAPGRVPSIYHSFFDISKRGNRLVMTAGRGDVNIWQVGLDADGLPAKGGAPKLILASTFRDAYPQYSPDGAYIAFYSNRSGGATQTWLAKTADQQVRQLTFPKSGLAGTASWSPDGRMLALDANGSGAYQVHTMSSEGGKMNQLTEGPASNFAATWSRDGRWLYFCSTRTGRNEVWKMPSGGGAARQITRNGGTRAMESLDGKTLYFSKDAGAGSIWEMPVSGGPERQIAASIYRHNFAVTKLGIYYTTTTQLDGTSSINLYRFADGSTTTILPIGRPEYGLDVSPDGRNLVYVRIDQWQSDLMLVENFR